MKLILFFVLFYVAVGNSEKFRFDNYTVYKIYPDNVAHVKLLEELQNDVRFDFWTDPVPSAEFVQVMTSPADKTDLLSFIDKNKLRSEITMDNVQE